MIIMSAKGSTFIPYCMLCTCRAAGSISDYDRSYLWSALIVMVCTLYIRLDLERNTNTVRYETKGISSIRYHSCRSNLSNISLRTNYNAY